MIWCHAAAKARAEQEFASARTQQEAERAEQAIKDTAAALKEVLRLKVAHHAFQRVPLECLAFLVCKS